MKKHALSVILFFNGLVIHAGDYSHLRKSRWRPLPNFMPLNQSVFLGSHNAFATGPVFVYRQHNMPLEQQVEYGVRALMLDTYPHKNDVYLCHRSCTGAASFAQTLQTDPAYKKLSDVLSWVRSWLKENTQEIMFVFLENYVKVGVVDYKIVDPLHDAIEQGMGKDTDMLVTRDDWNELFLPFYLDPTHYEPPTIGMLREKNKRLIIFCERNSQWTINQWRHIGSNAFSTMDVPAVCQEDRGMQQHPFYYMNYFKRITATVSQSMKYHTKRNMQHVLKTCFTGKRQPNIIFIDHIESLEYIKNKGEDDLLDLINEINEANQKTAQKVLAEKSMLLRANPKDLTEIRNLLEHRADPNVIDNQGFTPLMRVIMAHNCGRYEADPSSSYQECVKNPGKVKELCQTIELFFKKGAQWDIKDHQRGWTAYDYARHNGMTDSYLYPFVPLLRGQPMMTKCSE